MFYWVEKEDYCHHSYGIYSCEKSTFSSTSIKHIVIHFYLTCQILSFKTLTTGCVHSMSITRSIIWLPLVILIFPVPLPSSAEHMACCSSHWWHGRKSSNLYHSPSGHKHLQRTRIKIVSLNCSQNGGFTYYSSVPFVNGEVLRWLFHHRRRSCLFPSFLKAKSCVLHYGFQITTNY